MFRPVLGEETEMDGPAPSALRRTLVGAEALWWLLRPHDSSGVIAVGSIGWFTSRGPEVDWSLFWSLFTIVFGTGLIHVLNDLGDEDKDRVTAPYLPLPAGLITRRAAVASVVVGMPLLLLLLVLVIGPSHPARLAVALGLIALIVGLTIVYSTAKESAVLGTVVSIIPIVSLAVLAWLSGGAERPQVLAAVTVPYIALTAFAGTLYAALRDVDLDGDVGNLTVPVRIGGVATLRLAATIEAAGLVLIGVASAAMDTLMVLWVCGLAATVLSIAYGPYSRHLGEPDRGRRLRVADGYLWGIGCILKSVAMIVLLTDFAEPGWVAVGALLYLAIWRGLRRVYDVRIIRGGLAARSGLPVTAV